MTTVINRFIIISKKEDIGEVAGEDICRECLLLYTETTCTMQFIRG